MDCKELYRLLGSGELEGFAQCHNDELYTVLALIQRLPAIQYVGSSLARDCRSVRFLGYLFTDIGYTVVFFMDFHLLAIVRYLLI